MIIILHQYGSAMEPILAQWKICEGLSVNLILCPIG